MKNSEKIKRVWISENACKKIKKTKYFENNKNEKGAIC